MDPKPTAIWMDESTSIKFSSEVDHNKIRAEAKLQLVAYLGIRSTLPDVELMTTPVMDGEHRTMSAVFSCYKSDMHNQTKEQPLFS